MTEKEVSEKFVAVFNSCLEGHDGTRDSGTKEGREAFVDMYDLVYELAEHFKVDVSPLVRYSTVVDGS